MTSLVICLAALYDSLRAVIVKHMSICPFPASDDREKECGEYCGVMRGTARLRSDCCLILEEEVLPQIDTYVEALLNPTSCVSGGAGIAAVHLVLLPILQGVPSCSSEKVPGNSGRRSTG